ncbi:unnamed protein product [Cercopithifilaria johnstoni]|uniref:Zinc finger protein unc-98 n=1 Tax=Cercopithifilaria johnstoni TaxID=2874296 RepID=A0A8J2M511_9BILA|nr:unnamed protein product [Cercopithifilaria johnstoni]
MDESVAQSPKQQTPTDNSPTSAIPIAADNNDTQVAEITVQIELKGKESTANNFIYWIHKENSDLQGFVEQVQRRDQELRRDTPSEVFVSPTFCGTSGIPPAGVPHVPASAFISSALKQAKHVDTQIEDKNLFPEQSVHKQYSTKDFSSYPKILEEQVSKLPTSMAISTSAVSTGENPIENTPKNENGFIFYKCRFCGLTYNYLTTLRAHERVHNIDEPYKCNRCSESFHYLCELEYHAKQHTDLKGYKCECGRTFHSYTDLLYHKHPGDEDEESVTATAPTAQKSPIPENDFPIPEFMEKGFEPKHPLKVYSDVRLNPYICQYCSKSYPNSRMLAYHMYGHRGEKIFNPRASRYLMARTENSYISPGP